MAYQLLTRPIVSSCGWNAGGNPVVYKFRRYDHALSAINDNGGFLQLQINGTNLTSYYQLTNEVAIVELADTGYNTLFYEITASAFSGGNTLITLDGAYSGAIDSIYDAVSNITKRTDWKLFVDFKDSSGESLLNSSLLSFSPNGSQTNNFGRVTVDASILKNLLTPDWSLPATINEPDTGSFIEFYISSQEFYDDALQGSVTNDSGATERVFLVSGANQIGNTNGSNMLDHYIGDSAKRFLTKFYLSSAINGLMMWRDWPFTLSFIWPTTPADIYVDVRQFDAAGSAMNSLITQLTASTKKVHRIKISDLNANCKRLLVQLILQGTSQELTNSEFTSDITSWTGTGWSWTANNGGSAQYTISGSNLTSNQLNQSVALVDDLYRVTLSLLYLGSVGSESDINVTIRVSDGVQQHNFSSGLISDESTGEIELDLSFSYSGVVAGVGIVISRSLTNVNNIIRLTSLKLFSGNDIYSHEIPIEVIDVCNYNEDYEVLPEKNPIHLYWRNSNGGDSFCNFAKYHEYTYFYSNSKKAKRIILFATHLTTVQWEAISELNSIGEVYQTPIIELTTDINSTSKRVGQQVYIVSKDGETKTGVIVIPSSDRQLSRDVTHTIAVEIELPEIFGTE